MFNESTNKEKIKIIGGNKLNGAIQIEGAKNSALPLIATSILANGKMVLSNMPNLSDIYNMVDILRELNIECDLKNNQLHIDNSKLNKFSASYELVSKMRASVLILGPLLAKYHKAEVPLPGGCSIGSRPVDMHIEALKSMGANIEIQHGNIIATTNGKLKGAEIYFKHISVGATENILMAATLAQGNTKIINAACEPEIVDLANLLIKMGAKIIGAGSNVIEVQGVDNLYGVQYSVMPDRIETGSYALATLATGGNVILKNTSSDILGDFKQSFEKAGGKIIDLPDNSLQIISNGVINPVDISTNPYPDFPTDLQAPWMATLCLAKDKSFIKENIFENRFTHAPELIKMGANIVMKDNNSAIIYGVKNLEGAKVNSTDLRASFALIIAGLCAQGETTILGLHHLDRGYVDVVNKLRSLGANINRGVNI